MYMKYIVLFSCILIALLAVAGCNDVKQRSFSMDDINTKVVCPYKSGDGSCYGDCELIFIPNPNDKGNVIKANGMIIKDTKEPVIMNITEGECTMVEVTKLDGSTIGRWFKINNNCAEWTIENCNFMYEGDE